MDTGAEGAAVGIAERGVLGDRVVQALGGGVGPGGVGGLRGPGDGHLEPDLGGRGHAQGDEQQRDPALEAEQAGLDHAIAHGAAASQGGTDTHQHTTADGAHGGLGIRHAHPELTGGLGRDEGADQQPQHQHDAPVHLVRGPGSEELGEVRRRAGDAQPVVAAVSGGQRPGDHAQQTDAGAGGVHVQRVLPGGSAWGNGPPGAGSGA